MKVPVIKKLIENHSVESLKKAEENLLEEKPPGIDVEGEDEGEQLTHVIAAAWVKEKMEEEDLPLNKALRAYTQRVRKSID